MPPPSLMNVASENLILRLSSKLSQGCALVPPEDAALKCKIICATRGDEIHLISFLKDAAMPERGFGVWTDTFQPEMRSHLTGPGVILISLFVCLFVPERVVPYLNRPALPALLLPSGVHLFSANAICRSADCTFYLPLCFFFKWGDFLSIYLKSLNTIQTDTYVDWRVSDREWHASLFTVQGRTLSPLLQPDCQ